MLELVVHFDLDSRAVSFPWIKKYRTNDSSYQQLSSHLIVYTDSVFNPTLTPLPLNMSSPPRDQSRGLARVSALDPSTTAEKLISILEEDGAVIVTNLIPQASAHQIHLDLKPHFDGDGGDKSGFFPSTTRRATGLLGISPGCVELALNPLFNAVAEHLLTDSFTYFLGQTKHTSVSKPQISSTVAFQVNPGGKQQGLHRDEIDYHIRHTDRPMLIGCVTAVTKTTRENGATIVIPGSHKWDDERVPLDEEAVPAELEPGDATIFLGGTYHAGGGNITT